MFRRFLPAFCVVAVVLSGCGKKPAPQGGRQPATPSAPKKATLTFWHIITYTDALEKAVERFEKANPDVTVDVQRIANDAFKEKLNIEMSSGRPPDVFFTWGGGRLFEFARHGKVHPLTDALKQNGWGETFLPQPLRFCTYRDKVYAVPLDLSCVPLWYNADVFQQHKLEPPKTYAELIAVCKQLREKGITPIALGNKKVWPGAFYFIYLAARSGGVQLFADAAARKPGVGFNNLPFIRAGERLQDLVKADVFSKGFNGIEDGEARTQFLNGQAAMYLMGTWLVARAKQEKPEFLSKMKCFPFPAVQEGKGDPSTVVGGTNGAFAVSSACEHPEKAVELLRFLTDQTTAQTWCEIGRIPAVKVKPEVLESLPEPTRAALGILRGAGHIQQYYDQYLTPRLKEEHIKTTQELFQGTIEPGPAADRMEKAAQETGKR